MSQDIERCHVLVVDEDRLMRWFLVQVAQDAGCLAVEVPDADAALAYLRESQTEVELVLLDCPRTYADLAAVAAIKRLRPACRLVLMTAFSAEAFVNRARALGADQVLVKPVDPDGLRRVLDALKRQAPAAHRPPAFRLEIPKALQRDRDDLRSQLARVAGEEGQLAEMASRCVQVLHAHILREERFALPPLSLLPLLANGFVWTEMGPGVAMAETLNANLPDMLEDHEEMLVVLRALEQAARQAGRSDVTLLVQRLMEHGELEAEVLYPAAIVAGRFLETQLAARPPGAS
jgi:DNA-binding response OmpR family regulator